MGVMARRFEEFAEARFDRQAWLNDDDGEAPRSSSGIRVDRAAALGLTTVWRCVDLLSSAIAQSPKDITIKVGGRSFPEFTRPSWLSAPNPADPTYTIDDYFSQVAVSLLIDGNYFTHVYPHVLDPQVLTVLDPSRVTVKPGPTYEIKDASGKVIRTAGPMEMLHGTWIRLPGMARGISPLEALRRSIGSAIAAEDHAARFFGQGASLSFGVEVPGAMDKAKKDEMRESLRKKYAGLQNSHAIGVLTQGAKFVTGLTPSPEQSQMLATRKFSVEDLCRPYGVPPGMVGSQEAGASSYASSETNDKWFAQRGVQPLAVRIETQHDRLLEIPDGITDPNAKAQFRFNLSAIERATILTRFQAYSAGVQGGFITPNGARAKEDLEPLPGGDQLYMQQQMVPLGADSAKVNDLGALVRAGFDPEAAAAFLGLPAIKHTGLVPVTVQGENVATTTPGA